MFGDVWDWAGKIRRMLFTFRVQGLLWNYGSVWIAW
jgi:fido (protein-threonine AMPylation protein)